MIPAFFRFYGTEGVLNLEPEVDGVDVRWRAHDLDDWERETVDEDEWTGPIQAAIEHVIESPETGDEPVLSARNALNATEIIFGIWESARRRGCVGFPLDIDDNPLQTMVESDDLDPASKER